MKFVILFMLSVVAGQRKNFIQNLVTQIKNSPRHKSASPSFNGERKFDVIGTGELPLQSDIKVSESGSQFRAININKAPSIDDVITGSIARFETSSDGVTSGETDAAGKDTNLPFLDKAQLTDSDTMTEHSQDEDQLLSQGSHSSISRPSGPRKRRRNPNNAFRVRPHIGDLVTKFLNKDKRNRRKPNSQRKRPSRNPDTYNERNELAQVEVEEFFPFEDNQKPLGQERKKHKPRGEQLYNRPKRKQGSSKHKVNKPLKNLPVRRPLKHQNRIRDNNFRPPSKVYHGFAPTFKGSLTYEEAKRQQERETFENNVRQNERGPYPSKSAKRKPAKINHKLVPPSEEIPNFGPPEEKRPTRFGPDRPRRQRPRPQTGQNINPFAEEHPSFERPQEENSGRFAPDNPRRPSPFNDEISPFGPSQGNSHDRFTDDQPRRPRPSHEDQVDILPFSEEIPSFGPGQDRPNRFRPDRPKRQRPRPITEDIEQHKYGLGAPGNSFKEPIFKDAPNDNMGFFNDVQENFPDIGAFGVGWDPQKVRRKRAAIENPFYYKPEPRRPRRGHRPRQAIRQTNRRQGPGGFWDDADFDAEFFNGGSPQAFNSFDAFSQKGENPFKTQFSQPVERPRGLRTARRPNAKPKITPKKYQAGGYSSHSGTSYNQLQSVEDNSILGSGNFEILKGGTFYEEDDYRRPYSNNQAPPPYNYYGNSDIFHNFRDFADIKGDRNNNRAYEEGFYYR